jgi:hypothetical protein
MSCYISPTKVIIDPDVNNRRIAVHSLFELCGQGAKGPRDVRFELLDSDPLYSKESGRKFV